MSILEHVYLQMPGAVQRVLFHFEGWRVQRGRYGAEFDRLLHEAEAREYASDSEISEYRDARLRAFIRHCAETIPYYREQFARSGLDPNTIHGLSDLSALPILTKDTVREQIDRFTSEAVPPGARRMTHTSGTTGSGLRFYTTVSAMRAQWAVWWRYRRWHGIEPATWCGYFGGRSVVRASTSAAPYWRYNYPGRQIAFSAYHLNPRTIDSYAKELRKQKPCWLHGYPSSLALLAGLLEERRTDLGYGIKWVTTGAENLLPHQKLLIERVFGVAPRQHYGLSEGVANISECERGRLHVDEDFAAVEFVGTSGEGRRLVGTNMTNPATGLIRYETNDIVQLSSERCDCGRPGRIVAAVDGRQEDYVLLTDGSRLGRLDHIFKDMVGIREAQIRQERVGELILRIVPASTFNRTEELRLVAELRQRIGDRAEVRIEQVASLPRTSTGKLRLVVSELPPLQIQSAGVHP